MSTKFTKSRIPDQFDAPLTVLLQSSARWVLLGVLKRLRTRGYEQIKEPHLTLLGNLDCGATHASAVAERMGVSRQAIARTLRELEAMGFVRLDEDPVRKNQKTIVMTESGEDLALSARRALADTEAALAERIGSRRLEQLRDALRDDWREP